MSVDIKYNLYELHPYKYKIKIPFTIINKRFFFNFYVNIKYEA